MSFYQLPTATVPVCISDLHRFLQLKSKGLEVEEALSKSNGTDIRVCGRVSFYDPSNQVLQLVEPPRPASMNQGSDKNVTAKAACLRQPICDSVMVDTSLIGNLDFHCRKGTQLLCIGEVQPWGESRFADDSGAEADGCNVDMTEGTGKNSDKLVVKATICKLVDGLDYGKYCQYVEVIRQKNLTFPS